MRLRLYTLIGLLFFAAPAQAEDEVDLSGVKVGVPAAQGQERWGAGSLIRAVRRELAEAVELLPAEASLQAEYILQISITRRGWLYSARALLLHKESGETRMDFRAEYYRPDTEAADRGQRIARKALQKLALLHRAVAPPPVVTSTAAPSPPPPVVTSPAPEPSPDAAFAAAFDAPLAGPELDGFEGEGGWTWTVRGWIGTSAYGFFSNSLADGKKRAFAKVGTRSTLTGKLGEGARLRVLPLVEVDLFNQRLHRLVLEEGFLELSNPNFELRLGWDALTWGAASTVNIVDVINARDLSEGVVDAPKIGQPMISARLLFGNHSLALLYLTPFVPPQFPRADSPFVPFDLPPGVDPTALGERLAYASKLEEWHPQAATRLSLSFTGLDLRASYFYGYGRVPLIDLMTLNVFFPLIHHASTDGQAIFGQTTIKWELASLWHQKTARSPTLPGQRFLWIVGIEHTFEEFLGSGTLVPVAEFIGDSDSVWFKKERPPDDTLSFFQNHLIAGVRWSLNNFVDSELTLADIVDLSHPGDHLLSAEYSERWFSHFTFVLGGRLGIAGEGHKLSALRQLTSIYTQIRLNY